MERGMKSDTTEMVLLGAAAAVIALVVAFSMMDDKGSKKRSLEEMADDAGEEAGAEVEGLKEAAAEVKESVSKFQKVAENVKEKLPPDGRAARALSTIQSGVSKAKPFVDSAAAIIPDEFKEEAKTAILEKGKEVGGRALKFFREEFGRSVQQNLKPKPGGFYDKLFKTPKKQPLPDEIEMDQL